MRRKEVKVFFGKGYKKGRKKAVEYASEATYRRGKIIWSSMDTETKGMMVMEVVRKHIMVDRPMVVGFAVLELSKWWMFDFHYGCAKPFFGDTATLLYTDTDSLVYHFQGLSESLAVTLEKFNEAYHRLDDSKLGDMKDEHAGKRVIGFCALRPKMYAFLYPTGVPKKDQKMRHKGYPVKSIQVNTGRNTTFEDFWLVHMGSPGSKVAFNKIRPVVTGSNNVVPMREPKNRPWELHTEKVVKRGLAATDDKSYWFSRERVVRFGHYSIMDSDD